MNCYTKGAIEEYLERNRQVLEDMRDQGVFTQAHVECELDNMRRKIMCSTLLLTMVGCGATETINGNSSVATETISSISSVAEEVFKAPENYHAIVQVTINPKSTYT